MNNEIGIGLHSVTLKSRKYLVITGVKSLDSYDDAHVVVSVGADLSLTVEGVGISVKDVNIDKEILEAEGDFSSFYYDENKTIERVNFFGRLFGKK